MTMEPNVGRSRRGWRRRASARPGSILQVRLATIFAAQFFDFGTFTVMIGRHGIVTEANPIVAQGFIVFGLPFVAAMKLALIVLVGAVVVLLGRSDPKRRACVALSAIVTVVAVAAGLVGGISNASVVGW